MKRRGGTYVIELSSEEVSKCKRMEVQGLDDEGGDDEFERLIKKKHGEGEVVFRRQAR